VVNAGSEIIRPVIMNNSTTIFGMLPILFGFGPGTDFQRPLSLVVVSGLLVSVIISLFILPVIFHQFHKKS
jgi:cobalt-zinc-cadmium resistance protein CzcA